MGLGLIGHEKYEKLYYNLKDNTTNLKPYYEFIACIKKLLGPSRKWNIIDEQEVASIIILPAYHGHAIDYDTVSDYVAAYISTNDVDYYFDTYHPFYHGDKEFHHEYYGFQYKKTKKVINSIELNEHFCQAKYNKDRTDITIKNGYNTKLYTCNGPWRQVPRYDLSKCIKDFKCTYLQSDDIVDSLPVYYENSAVCYHRQGKVYPIEYFLKKPPRYTDMNQRKHSKEYYL